MCTEPAVVGKLVQRPWWLLAEVLHTRSRFNHAVASANSQVLLARDPTTRGYSSASMSNGYVATASVDEGGVLYRRAVCRAPLHQRQTSSRFELHLQTVDNLADI